MFLGNPVGERDLLIVGKNLNSFIYSLILNDHCQCIHLCNNYNSIDKSNKIFKEFDDQKIELIESEISKLKPIENGYFVEFNNNFKINTSSIIFCNKITLTDVLPVNVNYFSLKIENIVENDKFENKIFLDSSSELEISDIVRSGKWKKTISIKFFTYLKDLLSM